MRPSQRSTVVPGGTRRSRAGRRRRRDISLPRPWPPRVGLEAPAAAEGLQVAQRVVAAQRRRRRRGRRRRRRARPWARATRAGRTASRRRRFRPAPRYVRDRPARPGNDRSHGRPCVPDRRRLDGHRRRHRPPGRRGGLQRRARRALRGQAASAGRRDRRDRGPLRRRRTTPTRRRWSSARSTTYGRIDVVFANAGVGHPRGFEAGDPEDAKQMVLTNVFGIYATIRATAAALRADQGPPRDHVQHRRPAGAQGLALLARPSSPSPAWPRPRARTSTAPACGRR